ncbi:DUF1330 domain-containing protein [Actinoplanes regularis]|uniref:Uncharacterized conserved protein, DUF1330 family n=1 Tax=Actinoplanes regularis TaxID=52697 RepID=A0A239DZY0_9ACTN|nr:DUF1330 domain-containing protein [Actinoplanes regularis]GIE88916.1 hypothetical protein Are01nite_53960 [Actinoplanes regularis]GLW34959.1 hypothetical protein Areg01_78950 [Actinoplanes regularis]SNS37917.1 Uncharacterized conserved protein, DUF1330 family [Actinoplanes regularis]
MTAYAVAHLRTTSSHDDVITYIELIQETMDPYGGRFLVHGPEVEVVEGEWPGTLVLLAFPDLDSAHDWYASPAYRKILPLRTAHIAGDIILAEGVAPGYDARQTAAAIRAAAEPES